MGVNVDKIWIVTIILALSVLAGLIAIMYFGFHTQATYIIALLIFAKVYGNVTN